MKELLNLVRCEFQKLKRKRFIQLTIAAACLFPIPLMIAMAKDEQPFIQLFRAVVLFADLLFLPCVLGIIASMLFSMEQDNDTLKNLLAIPVSKTKIYLTKLTVLFLLSLIYSLAAYGASLIGGLIVGEVSDVLFLLLVSTGLGIFVFLATIPVIAIIIICNKSSVFSIIVAFIYAVVGFALVQTIGRGSAFDMLTSILPICITGKWYFGIVPVEQALSYILPHTLSTPVAAGLLTTYGIAFALLSLFRYRRAEI